MWASVHPQACCMDTLTNLGAVIIRSMLDALTWQSNNCLGSHQMAKLQSSCTQIRILIGTLA